MARLLISDEYPHGHELGAIFEAIRKEVLRGSHQMTHDGRPETRHLLGHVLDSNRKVLEILNEARNTLETLFGPSPRKQPVAVPCADETKRQSRR